MTLLEKRPVQPTDMGPPDDPEIDGDQPLRRRRFATRDIVEVACAVLAALALGGILKEVFDWGGIMSTGIWCYIFFLLAFYYLQRAGTTPQTGSDRVIAVMIWSVGLLVIAALGWMLFFVASKGIHDLKPSFFTQDMSKVGPLTPGGGARAAIIGSVEQVGIAVAIVLPLGILTAVYLHEQKGSLARPVRFFVDALSGKPSIVAGLVVYSFYIVGHPGRFSGIAASAALLILMLPLVTGPSEEVLRTVPDPLREASYALGAPQWRTVLRVVLPTARSGLMTAGILALARGVGETAPVLLTSAYTTRTNYNPFHGPQADLPTFIYTLIFVPNTNQKDRAWTAALILLILVLLLFSIARFLSARAAKKLGRRS